MIANSKNKVNRKHNDSHVGGKCVVSVWYKEISKKCKLSRSSEVTTKDAFTFREKYRHQMRLFHFVIVLDGKSSRWYSRGKFLKKIIAHTQKKIRSVFTFSVSPLDILNNANFYSLFSLRKDNNKTVSHRSFL